MDEHKEKQNAKKKRSALPIYAIGIVWLLYAGKLNTFRGILSCAVVSAIVYAILRIVLPGKKTDEPPKAAAPEQPQPKQAEKKPEENGAIGEKQKRERGLPKRRGNP